MGNSQDEYATLWIRDEVCTVNGVPFPCMTAAFELTPDELKLIQENRGRIILTILGTQWPPVSLEVQTLEQSH